MAYKKTGNPVGRPKKKKGKNPVGRPKGQAAIIQEYQQRMFTSPKSPAVLESIYDAALNDEHKNQAAAWKLIIDRLMPMSHFEKDKLNSGRSAIEININTTGTPKIPESKPIDVEFTDVEDGNDH